MRIAIIGAGTMAQVHAAALTQIADVAVVAFGAPEIPETTAALARQLGADLLSSATEALARPDVDAVIVATPTDVHHRIVIEAARAGKHIICEKPLARTREQGEAMLAAVAEAGVKLGVGHVVRYFPEYAAAHKMIVQGELGTPGVARLTRGAGYPQVPDHWYADVERSGGVVLDMMIHDFDWLRWAFGPVERLHAQGLTYSARPGKDAAMAILRFRSGALAYVEGNWAYPSGFRTSLEVSGSAGLIRTSSHGSAPLRFELAPSQDTQGVAVPTGGLIEDPYLLQLRDLVRWLGGGPPPRVSGEDALEALRIGLAALESIRTGQPITFGAGA
jgi:predicted dehydrogenase